MTTSSFLKLIPQASRNARPGPVVRRDRTGLALFAARSYAPGEVVFEFRNLAWRIDRDRFTVEHPSGAHLFHPLLSKVSHSCEPNGRLDIRARAMVAIQPIEPLDCISFDYFTTERRISHPFDCLCGAERCRGRIE